MITKVFSTALRGVDAVEVEVGPLEAIALQDFVLPSRVKTLPDRAFQRTYFSEALRDYLLNRSDVLGATYEERYNQLFRGGLRIHTTLDANLQALRPGEEIAVGRDIRLAEMSRGHLHVAHVSTAGSVALVREAKAYGASSPRIVFVYLIPRMIPLLIPGLVSAVPVFVFLEASLAVLGLGDPVLPTWGKIIEDANSDTLTVGGSGQVLDFVGKQRPPRVVLLTECSMSDNVAADNPGVEFVKPCNLCPHMKRISLENIYEALLTMKHEVEVPEDVRVRAKAAIDAMLKVAREHDPSYKQSYVCKPLPDTQMFLTFI